MKKYNVEDKATYKGKEVKIVRKTENYSNRTVIYLLDNGKEVTGTSLTPIKKVKKISEKKKSVSVVKPEDKKNDNSTNTKAVEKSDSKKETAK